MSVVLRNDCLLVASLLQVGAGTYDFAVGGSGKKKNCNPAKSHFCVGKKGTGACVPLTKKCAIPATGAALGAADFIAKQKPEDGKPQAKVAKKSVNKSVPGKLLGDAKKQAIAAKANAEPPTSSTPKYSGDDFYKVGGFGPTAIPPSADQLMKEFKGISVIENDADKPGSEITSLQNKGGNPAEVKSSAQQIADRMNQLHSPPSEDRLPATLKAMRSGKPIKSQKDFDSAMDEVLDHPDFAGDIYLMRRAMGDRASRADFDKYLFDAQSRGGIQLYSGSLDDIYPPGILDSVSSKVSGLRTKVKRKGQ